MSVTRIPTPRRSPVRYDEAIPYSALCIDDQRQFDEALHTPDPYEVLRAKTTHLADLLGCSEAEAERVILKRIGTY